MSFIIILIKKKEKFIKKILISFKVFLFEIISYIFNIFGNYFCLFEIL
jgi:hypothetical protein